MAYLVGYVTQAEKEELERRGWEVEDAKDYNLIGPPGPGCLLSGEYAAAHEADGSEAVVIFVDNDLFSIMDGPDWEKSHG